MAKKEPPKPPAPATDTRLSELLTARGFEKSPEPTPAKSGALDLSGQGKLVLRRERKGRGGKTVTILSGLNLPPTRLEELAKALRKGLGCGATIEDDVIVLLGDLSPRAKEWLEKHGAGKIVVGN